MLESEYVFTGIHEDRDGRLCWTVNGVECRTDRSQNGVWRWSSSPPEWNQVIGTTQSDLFLRPIKAALAAGRTVANPIRRR